MLMERWLLVGGHASSLSSELRSPQYSEDRTYLCSLLDPVGRPLPWYESSLTGR